MVLKTRCYLPQNVFSRKGQAIVEYLILLTLLVSVYMMVVSWLKKQDFQSKFMEKLTKEYSNAYLFGKLKLTPGGKPYYPIQPGKGNDRVFMSPKTK